MPGVGGVDKVSRRGGGGCPCQAGRHPRHADVRKVGQWAGVHSTRGGPLGKGDGRNTGALCPGEPVAEPVCGDVPQPPAGRTGGAGGFREPRGGEGSCGGVSGLVQQRATALFSGVSDPGRVFGQGVCNCMTLTNSGTEKPGQAQIGKMAHLTLGLKQKMGGINKDKYQALKLEISKLSCSNSMINVLENDETILLRFIEVRNTEKVNQNALKEPPTISPEGRGSGGKVWNAICQEEYDFCVFINESYSAIMRITKLLLG